MTRIRPVKGAFMDAPRNAAAPMKAKAATSEPGQAAAHGRPMTAPMPAPSATAGVRTPPQPPARIVRKVVSVLAASTSAATPRPAPAAHVASNWVWALACPLPSTEGTHTAMTPTRNEAMGSATSSRQSRGRSALTRATACLNAHPAAPRRGPARAAKTVRDRDGVRVGTL